MMEHLFQCLYVVDALDCTMLILCSNYSRLH